MRDFKGKTYVDIRETYEKDGETLPGKKGIMLNIEQWDRLKKAIGVVSLSLSRALCARSILLTPSA